MYLNGVRAIFWIGIYIDYFLFASSAHIPLSFAILKSFQISIILVFWKILKSGELISSHLIVMLNEDLSSLRPGPFISLSDRILKVPERVASVALLVGQQRFQLFLFPPAVLLF